MQSTEQRIVTAESVDGVVSSKPIDGVAPVRSIEEIGIQGSTRHHATNNRGIPHGAIGKLELFDLVLGTVIPKPLFDHQLIRRESHKHTQVITNSACPHIIDIHTSAKLHGIDISGGEVSVKNAIAAPTCIENVGIVAA